MGGYTRKTSRMDFVVKHDFATEPIEALTKKIVYSVFIKKRIKANKPCIIFIQGDSGEGKSWGALRWQELWYEVLGLPFNSEILKASNVFMPVEYGTKLDGLLYSKELKKYHILCVHEAREVVKAKLWFKFISQAISDVNAMSRGIKPLCFIIISQFIRDITTDIRYTLNFYIKATRNYQQNTHFDISIMYKDDFDLHSPKLKKRRLRGLVIGPDGRYKFFSPKYLEMSKPSKDIREEFDKMDTDAKANLLRKKLDSLLDELKIEMGMDDKRVELLVSWYMKHPENIPLICKRTKRGMKLKVDGVDIHGLTTSDTKIFINKLNEELKKTKIMDNDDYSEHEEQPEVEV